MPRKKTTLKSKIQKQEVLVFPHPSTLRSTIVFEFFRTHKEPKRPPIVNIIRKTMIEVDWGKKEYTDFNAKYKISERRIRETLSSKFEPIVITLLCEYLDIPEKETTRDILGNYNFEQKDICKRKGSKSEEQKQLFLKEFKKSWSDEVYQEYVKETIDSMNLISYDEDEEVQKFEDLYRTEEKKTLFRKLEQIYEEYPELLIAFCDSFIEE